MASEKEADLAREEHADFLHDLGAHGITIDEIKREGAKSFAVVALFEDQPKQMPDTLEIKRGKKTLTVPLVARVTEKFRPE
ncbi:MAG TPA: hypothetical protein VMS31_02140 [Pyrinomonadaceae bacterium]|nr:hypothetical protein [Pyrinomonadaceae bacterium]